MSGFYEGMHLVWTTKDDEDLDWDKIHSFIDTVHLGDYAEEEESAECRERMHAAAKDIKLTIENGHGAEGYTERVTMGPVTCLIVDAEGLEGAYDLSAYAVLEQGGFYE